LHLDGKGKKIGKKILLSLVVLLVLCVVQLDAAPTTVTQAENVVRGWLKADVQPLGMALGWQITNIETFSDANEQPIYYVVYLEPTGFVIVPADDLVEPIIGFVEEGIYDPSPDNPLGALVSHDLPCRIAAARDLQIATSQSQKKDLLNDQQATLETASVKAQTKWAELQGYADMVMMQTLGLSGISEVWVAPLVQSKWNQDSECGHYCYNYYTPNHYYCGCVATAMAQVIRFHEYPIEGIGVHPFAILVGGGCFSGDPQTAYTRGGDGAGGPYKWSDMVFDPDCENYTDERWEAIGALCYDAGISMGTNYNSDGSCSSSSKAKTALNEVFGYSNAVVVPCIGVEQNELNDMINTNLDANYPVILSIGIQGLGHEVVADGYGYDFSTIYHHVNMGWGGSCDAWYNLPDPGVAFFTGVHACIYNIFRIGSGEIISGRVIYEDGSPISGATVSADTGSQTYDANTNDKGIYALTKVPSNTTFTISVSKGGYTFVPQNVATGYSDPNAEHLYSPAGNRWGIDFQGVSGLHPVIQLSAEDVEFFAIEGGSNPEPQILSIANCGFETLNWVITDDCNWLEVDPNSGTSTGEPNEVMLSIDTTNLTHGSYSCELTVTDPCALNSPKTAHVILYVTNELHVPGQYPTIQAAIDASAHGCTIIVAPGIYTGQGNCDLDFDGKRITVRSTDPNNPNVVRTTIIDCNGTELEQHRGFYFHNDEDVNSILRGFAITGGYNSGSGGAIYCEESSPTITNCVLVANTAGDGGAIGCFLGNPTIMNCVITGNLSNGMCGLLPSGSGGGVSCIDSSPTITNCTISGNYANCGSGGIIAFALFTSDDGPIISNCILWNDTPEEIYFHVFDGAPFVTYSNVEGGWSGDGNNNIDTDPCFALPGFWADNGTPSDASDDYWINGDYHLKSLSGRWKPSIYAKLDPTGDGFIDLVDFAALANYWQKQGSFLPADLDNSGLVDLVDLRLLLDNYLADYSPGEWVFDDVNSPCIDTGDPNSDWTAELWPHGKCVNMGAYGGTPEASMSLSNTGNAADLNNNDSVGYTDLMLFTTKWLYQEVLLSEDFNRNGYVDFTDFAVFANEWLWQE